LENLQKIARFLLSLKRPEEIINTEFRKFKNKALGYIVLNKELYQRQDKTQPIRLVVDSLEEKRDIISSYYKELGYKERESTYNKVNKRFY